MFKAKDISEVLEMEELEYLPSVLFCFCLIVFCIFIFVFFFFQSWENFILQRSISVLDQVLSQEEQSRYIPLVGY